MANVLYDAGRNAFLTGGIDWLNDDIKALLVDLGAYTPNFSSHQFLSDVTGVVATSVSLTGKIAIAGVADASPANFSTVSGPTVEAIIVFKDTTVASTSPLIAFMDTAVSGLPFTPAGSDVQVAWDTGSNKIFKL